MNIKIRLIIMNFLQFAVWEADIAGFVCVKYV